MDYSPMDIDSPGLSRLAQSRKRTYDQAEFGIKNRTHTIRQLRTLRIISPRSRIPLFTNSPPRNQIRRARTPPLPPRNPRRITGMCITIYTTLSACAIAFLTNIWGLLRGAPNPQPPPNEIIAVETDASGKKRRAIDADSNSSQNSSPPKSSFPSSTASDNLPGCFLEVDDKSETQTQLATPPDSRPNSSQGQAKHDTPMADILVDVSDNKTTKAGAQGAKTSTSSDAQPAKPVTHQNNKPKPEERNRLLAPVRFIQPTDYWGPAGRFGENLREKEPSPKAAQKEDSPEQPTPEQKGPFGKRIEKRRTRLPKDAKPPADEFQTRKPSRLSPGHQAFAARLRAISKSHQNEAQDSAQDEAQHDAQDEQLRSSVLRNSQRDAEIDQLIGKAKAVVIESPEDKALRRSWREKQKAAEAQDVQPVELSEEELRQGVDYWNEFKKFREVPPPDEDELMVAGNVALPEFIEPSEEGMRLYLEELEKYKDIPLPDESESSVVINEIQGYEEQESSLFEFKKLSTSQLPEPEELLELSKKDRERLGYSHPKETIDAEYAKKQQLIRPLDPDWDEKVNKTMETKNRRQIITQTVSGTDLTRHDFGSLIPQRDSDDAPSGWLNDEIVNAWMDTIISAKKEQTGYKKTSTSVPAYVAYPSMWYSTYKAKKSIIGIQTWSRRQGIKGEKLLQAEKIFFPVNTGAHWMLLIISPKARKIEFLDSVNQSGIDKRFCGIAREWLAMELGDKYVAEDWMDMPSRSAYQLNSDDCGVFVCFNALASAKEYDFAEVGKGKMSDARRLMAAILMNGGLKGDFTL